VAEHLLQNQHQALYGQLRQLGNERLIQLLRLTAGQQYEQAATRERMAKQSYEEAKQAAISLGGAKARLDMLQAEWDRLQNTYDVVVQRLKDINLGQKSGTFRARPLSEPKVPSHAVSPRLTLIGMLSMLLGLGVGLLIVYVQDLMDDRFRSPEELQRQLGFPILAMVRRLEPLADCGTDAVHVHVQPNAAETEAFRTLRTALALSGDGMQRLVVSSSEPGDGKTTITVNLAAAYAQSGKRTLVIDADMRRPGLTPLLDLKGQRGLSTALRDDAPIGEAAEANLSCSAINNLDVLPAGPRPVNPTELLAGDRFSELLSWAETRYDQILLDSPPALVSDMAIIGRLVDGVVLTVQPEKNRRRVVLRVAESFPLLGIRVAGVVVNRVDSDGGKDYYNYDYAYGYSYGHDDADDAVEDHGYDEPPATVVRRVA
jgi:capsular exopolysaccharide synthesis family protein